MKWLLFELIVLLCDVFILLWRFLILFEFGNVICVVVFCFFMILLSGKYNMLLLFFILINILELLLSIFFIVLMYKCWCVIFFVVWYLGSSFLNCVILFCVLSVICLWYVFVFCVICVIWLCVCGLILWV